MTTKVKVFHIIHDLKPGGAEEVLVELAHASAGAGMEIAVLSLTRSDPRMASALTTAGAAVVTLGLASRWDLRALRRVQDMVGEAGPDLVHTHLKHADLVGAWTAVRLGVPMVSTLHRIENDPKGIDRLKGWAGSQARARVASRTIAVSDSQRRWYLEHFAVDPASVVTVHNGIRPPARHDSEAGPAIRRSLGVADGDVLALVPSVLREGKGHFDLLEALRRIPPSAPLRVALAGDGPLAGPITRAVEADRSLAARVLLLGWRSDVDRLLAGTDILVHPSRADAFPTALLHGLAAGVPAVASQVGGVPELVDDSTGVLVPPGDPPALAQALGDLTADPERRRVLGEAAHRRFVEQFTAERWAQRLRALYDDVVGR